MQLIKENAKGKTYQAEKCKILYRHKDSIAGDNDHNPAEVIYFIQWSAKITLEDKVWTIAAPAEVSFPAHTYHKIQAITDISFIVFDTEED